MDTKQTWELSTGKLYREAANPKHRGAIKQLLYSTDGKRLVSLDEDGLVHVWEPETGKLLFSFTDRGTIQEVTFSGRWRHCL